MPTFTAPVVPTVAPPTPAEVVEKMREAIELMNENGKHWVQKSYVARDVDGFLRFCISGAFATVAGAGLINDASFLSEQAAVMYNALAKAVIYTLGRSAEWNLTNNNLAIVGDAPITAWNDAEGRTWNEVKSLLESAIERLEGGSHA